MNSLLLFVGVVGNVLSFLVILSPIKTFWRIVKNKSTGEFEPAPYVVAALSALLCVYYGITEPRGYLVAAVSVAGVMFDAAYVALFLVYAPPARRVKTGIMVGVMDIVFFGVVVLVTRLAVAEDMQASVAGIVRGCVSVFVYGSPLAVTKTVVSTKSVEYMPFLLSLSLFLSAGVWTLYAILDGDIFLGLPSGTGCFLGAVQLILYLIYMNNEQGLRHRPLVEPVDHHASWVEYSRSST